MNDTHSSPRSIILVALSAMLSSTSIAQKAHFVGESLVIADGTRRIRLPNVIEPHPEYRVVHAVQKHANDYFVVFGVSEWSRGYPPKNGNCGAGIESHIDWLHIRDGKIVQRQSGLYESCMLNRDGYSIEWQRGTLRWTTKGLRLEGEGLPPTFIWVNYSWTYDPAHPDKGIEEHSEDARKR
jgi:hypothetical protein